MSSISQNSSSKAPPLNWRSLLFVPADNATLCEKAANSEADAIILDLEDGVAAVAKDSARVELAAAAKKAKHAGKGVVVRINAPWRMALTDLEACVIENVDAVMTPKAENATRLVVLDEMIAELETERGLPSGAIGVIALVETPLGLTTLNETATAPRLIGLALGPEDLCAAIGVPPTPAVLDLPARQVALAAAAQDVMALASPASIAEFRDITAFEAGLNSAAAFGATGALCIHPAQIASANAVFSPSASELETARRILQAWTEAQSKGLSVTSLDGKMIDRPVVIRAERTIARAS